jgi:hypothetical protein
VPRFGRWGFLRWGGWWHWGMNRQHKACWRWTTRALHGFNVSNCARCTIKEPWSLNSYTWIVEAVLVNENNKDCKQDNSIAGPPGTTNLHSLSLLLRFRHHSAEDKSSLYHCNYSMMIYILASIFLLNRSKIIICFTRCCPLPLLTPNPLVIFLPLHLLILLPLLHPPLLLILVDLILVVLQWGLRFVLVFL